MSDLLDSRQVLAFVTLANTGSFTRASQELHLTQSAVSHAIKALEEDVGSRLFERSARRVFLTPAGEKFQAHAEKILGCMAGARAELDTLSTWDAGRLRVGASTTACQYILPTVLREFKQSFPRCAISIEPGDYDHQLELLKGNRVDLAIMLDSPGQKKDLSFVPLFEDELRFVAAPPHPWVGRRRSPGASISDQTLILYNKASLTSRLVTQYLRGESIAIDHVIELGSMDAIKELVKIGVGVGVLATWVIRAELENGALVSFPLGRRRLRRKWGISYRKGRRLSLAEETFVGLCRTVTENFGLPVAA
jgi:DNA-binding transcriptional LysR family regulator